jgi:hypothetical protein
MRPLCFRPLLNCRIAATDAQCNNQTFKWSKYRIVGLAAGNERAAQHRSTKRISPLLRERCLCEAQERLVELRPYSRPLKICHFLAFSDKPLVWQRLSPGFR